MTHAQEIFILINIAKMTLTEINTLTDAERILLSKWFFEKFESEQKIQQEYGQ